MLGTYTQVVTKGIDLFKSHEYQYKWESSAYQEKTQSGFVSSKFGFTIIVRLYWGAFKSSAKG